MHVTWVHIVAILLAGVAAGFINTLAGGGSFLTVAALDLAGLATPVANATNRVAILVQSIMAVLGFRSKGVSDVRLSLQVAIPMAVGAIVGAYVVVDLPEAVLRHVLAGAMILMLFTLVVDTRKWFKPRERELTPARRIIGIIVFLGVGFYGGAIQAGVGFLIIAALAVFTGLDLVRINSHKVFVTAAYTLFAVILFAVKGQIDWVLGLVLAAGNGAGAWIGSRMAAQKGERLVRIVLGVMLVIVAAGYLGLIPGF